MLVMTGTENHCGTEVVLRLLWCIRGSGATGRDGYGYTEVVITAPNTVVAVTYTFSTFPQQKHLEKYPKTQRPTDENT